jgi:hypothetical protein
MCVLKLIVWFVYIIIKVEKLIGVKALIDHYNQLKNHIIKKWFFSYQSHNILLFQNWLIS